MNPNNCAHCQYMYKTRTICTITFYVYDVLTRATLLVCFLFNEFPPLCFLYGENLFRPLVKALKIHD